MNTFEFIIEKIKEIHNDYPTLRFGEILQNSLDSYFRSNNNNLVDRSSKQILLALVDYQKQIVRNKK